MRLLDAVNLILPKLGEHEVTRLDVPHPTLAIILPEIENELRSVLGKGWWFNEYKYNAMPNSEGKIVLGTNVLSFTPTQVAAVLRGQELYNPETLSFVWTSPVEGVVRELLEFDVIPASAQQYVMYSALVNAYATDIGLEKEIQLWQTRAGAAYSDMLAEHLRQRKYSTRTTRKFQNLARALRA